MNNLDELIQMILTQTDGTLRYTFQPWNSLYVFVNEKGERLELSQEEIYLGGEPDFIKKIVGFMLKDIPLQLDDGKTASAGRVAEINDELDILRGVKPTPSGYKVDITRAKDLLAELKTLGVV